MGARVAMAIVSAFVAGEVAGLAFAQDRPGLGASAGLAAGIVITLLMLT